MRIGCFLDLSQRLLNSAFVHPVYALIAFIVFIAASVPEVKLILDVIWKFCRKWTLCGVNNNVAALPCTGRLKIDLQWNNALNPIPDLSLEASIHIVSKKSQPPSEGPAPISPADASAASSAPSIRDTTSHPPSAEPLEILAPVSSTPPSVVSVPPKTFADRPLVEPATMPGERKDPGGDDVKQAMVGSSDPPSPRLSRDSLILHHNRLARARARRDAENNLMSQRQAPKKFGKWYSFSKRMSRARTRQF